MEKYKQVLSIAEDEKVVIKAHENLEINGSLNTENIEIVTDLNAQKIRRESGFLRLIFLEDCELQIPENSEVVIERAGENARIKGLKSSLLINHVSGDLTLQHLHNVEIGRVGEDCFVEHISGQLRINKVSGDLKGYNINGGLDVERVGEDVNLLAVSGPISLRASGDIQLGLNNRDDSEINLQSGEDIHLNLIEEMDATFKIKSGSEDIQIKIGNRKEKFHTKRSEFILGDGTKQLQINASGDVIITSDPQEETEIIKLFEELEKLWLRLKEEGKAKRAAYANSSQWEVHMGTNPEEISHKMKKISEKVDAKTKKIIEEAEQRVQNALINVEKQIRNMGYVEDIHPVQTEEDYNKRVYVSNEEKLVIMRMLQEGKISVEEADQLLETLENPQD